MKLNALAKAVVITSSLTFPKQNIHTLRHIDPKESVEIPYESRDSSEDDRFRYPMLR